MSEKFLNIDWIYYTGLEGFWLFAEESCKSLEYLWEIRLKNKSLSGARVRASSTSSSPHAHFAAVVNGLDVLSMVESIGKLTMGCHDIIDISDNHTYMIVRGWSTVYVAKYSGASVFAVARCGTSSEQTISGHL
jgi:hypothetical protein